MPRFASAQDRINRACIRHLADAGAILGGSPVDVIFDRAYLSVDFGQSEMASSSPVARLLSSQVPANVVGLPLQITTGHGLGNWRVAAHQPDGSGISVLKLEKA